MTDPLLHTWNLNLGYAKRFVADIPDDTMALQPAPGMNHAASVLGHLAYTADMLGSHDRPACPPIDPRWLVYLLRCSDGSLYTGITNDLPKRLKAHAAGKASRYTRSRLPVKLAYSEPQRSKSAALKREVATKRLRRAEKVRLVAGK